MVRESTKYGKLTKLLEVRVIIPPIAPFPKRETHKRFHAAAGRWYSEKDIDAFLDTQSEHLEKAFPRCEFRLVELAFGKFNFIGSVREAERNIAA
jgi:hypothetical protein